MHSRAHFARERNRSARDGFTLIEILVAISILTIGLVALAGAAAATVRTMTDAARVGESARRADAARSRAFSTVCAASIVRDSTLGATIVSVASPSGSFLSVRQSLTLPRTAPATITLSAAGACR